MKYVNKEKELIRVIDELFLELDGNDELMKELLDFNPKKKQSEWSIELDGNEINLKNLEHFKVNIKDVGYVIAYFDKEKFDQASKRELINNIFSLKDIDVNASYDDLKNKLTSLFSFIKDNHPYFAVMEINNYHEEVKKVLDEISGMGYPLYFIVKEKEIEQPVEQAEKKEEENVSPFKASLLTIVKYKLEHAFNALYSLLCSLCMLLACIYLDNNSRGVGILFICFDILFIVLIAYNLYLFKKDNGKIRLFDYIFFIGFSLISMVLGIVFGYLLSKALVKFDDKVINYAKNIKIAIPLSLLSLGIAHGLRILFTFLSTKFKKAE